MAEQATPIFSEVDMKTAFAVYDVDGDGLITLAELEEGMRAAGLDPTAAEVRALMDAADTDKSGTIDYSEFSTLLQKKYENTTEEQRIQVLFQTYDKDNDGFLEAHELRLVLQSSGNILRDEDFESLFYHADIDGDGLIDYEEFEIVMKKLCRSQPVS